jgi:hypothetical protein
MLTRRAIVPVVMLLALVASASRAASAQVIPDSTRRDTTTVTPVVVLPDSAPRLRRQSAVIRAPISPRRAFLYSFALPGLAQSRLQRTTSGALFAGVEMAAIAMLRRSMSDVREVRRQGTDTVPGDFAVTPGTGALTPGLSVPPRFDEALLRTRKLHVEDWIAAIAFNHLISAADAFVSAQLWDVPTRVTLIPSPRGLTLAATVRF